MHRKTNFPSSNPILKSKPCARELLAEPRKHRIDDRFEFDAEECDITRGKWVFNSSIKLLYNDSSCSWTGNTLASKMVALISTTITGSGSPTTATCLERALRKLRAKGFSLRVILCKEINGNFVCMVEWTIPPGKKSMKLGKVRSVFKLRSEDWGKNNGLKCFNERSRVDAHSSIYTETGGRLLTDEEKADPGRHADCIHWCLPGVPILGIKYFQHFCKSFACCKLSSPS
ncbi:hypothetical protein F3Y22_tig00110482pilonHSYRG00130 [Hibiscus syriacus]|uniref:Trichome birefringence-like C-terminal domain-containing protein n=1 Tax=Hibiscus syriacus TaxID=106335 RepID=A0A6A3AD30_HIBSY|nr:hypothetical protein F3Y22_tig00110482pilonHSYRG00130 [Hibiscus syriacus]